MMPNIAPDAWRLVGGASSIFPKRNVELQYMERKQGSDEETEEQLFPF